MEPECERNSVSSAVARRRSRTSPASVDGLICSTARRPGSETAIPLTKATILSNSNALRSRSRIFRLILSCLPHLRFCGFLNGNILLNHTPHTAWPRRIHEEVINGTDRVAYQHVERGIQA